MSARVVRVLSIAGSDSGGGAGVQADVRTISRLGGHATTAITAVTAQNSTGVTASETLSADFVRAQIDAVANDIGVDAVKIGMLGSAETARMVADWVGSLNDIPVVFDPVMVASSGAALADDATIAAFDDIARRATLVTPNLPEWERLGGPAFAQRTGALLLVKGGHGEEDEIVDRLMTAAGERGNWEGARIDTRHDHGTGCTLSSAIATFLAQGRPMIDAIGAARAFVRQSLLAAPGLGRGRGPMGVPDWTD